MDCREIQKSLSSYAEGLLSPEEKKLVEGHLTSCAQCSASLAEMKKTTDLLRNLVDVEPPPWLTPKIMARVREENEQRAGFFKKLFFPFYIKVPLQALSVILVGVIVFQVYRMVEPEKKVAQAPSPPSLLTEQKALKEEIQPGAPKSGESSSSQTRQSVTAGQVLAEKDENAQPIFRAQGRGVQKPYNVPVPVGENASPITPAAPEEKSKKEVAGLASAPAQTETSRQRAYEGQPEDAEKANALSDKKRAEEEPITTAPPEIMKEQLAMQLIPCIIVSAPDTAVAKKAAIDTVKQLGGKEIETITQGATEIIIAQLPSEKIKELSEKLKTLGELKTEPQLSGLPEGNLRVQIEITSR